MLLSSGADVNHGVHELGVSALLAAVRVNAVKNVDLLLNNGAEPNSVVLFSETPLHTAASMGYSHCVKLLLKYGAGIEILMGQMKMSALHLASQEGKTIPRFKDNRLTIIIKSLLKVMFNVYNIFWKQEPM